MASLEKQRSGNWILRFRWQGRKFNRSLKTKNEQTAEVKLGRINELLDDIAKGKSNLPATVTPDELWDFLYADGKPPETKLANMTTLAEICREYLGSRAVTTTKESTQSTTRTHTRRLREHIGDSKAFATITTHDLDEYVEAREGDAGLLGRCVRGETILKELATFKAIWKWAAKNKICDEVCPAKHMTPPKTAGDDPPFRTFDEIAELVEEENLTGGAARLEWDCLFLSDAEIGELLEHIRQNKNLEPWVFPAIALAAFTGCRKSEVLRSMRRDLGRDLRTISLREWKKNTKQEYTLRTVHIHEQLLRPILEDWKARHPGSSPFLFPLSSEKIAARSNEADDAFKLAVADSKWSVVPGWHCLRHSFCSNRFRDGTPQQIIDEWVGHVTPQMQRRYRHLFDQDLQLQMNNAFRTIADAARPLVGSQG